MTRKQAESAISFVKKVIGCVALFGGLSAWLIHSFMAGLIVFSVIGLGMYVAARISGFLPSKEEIEASTIESEDIEDVLEVSDSEDWEEGEDSDDGEDEEDPDEWEDEADSDGLEDGLPLEGRSLRSWVYGVTLKNPDGKDRQTILKTVQAGDSLVWRIEYDETYDEEDVRLQTRSGDTIGELHQDVAEWLAPILKAGGRAVFKVAKVKGGTEKNPKLDLRVEYRFWNH